MKDLKQPELGQTIQSLRQGKKMTQEELVEMCNLNVRTLQRIEAGEVTPRDYTIRAILAALEFEFEEIEKSFNKKKTLTWLKWGWISGIVYFVLGIAETYLEFMRCEFGLPIYFPLVYSSVKIVTMVTFGIFMLGFVQIGKSLNSYLVQIGAFTLAGMMVLIEAFDIISLFSGMSEEEFWGLKAMEGMVIGGVEIIFGIGIWRLAEKLGIIANVASVFEIVVGACFLTILLSPIGLFLLIPATIIEIALIYKFYSIQNN